ncbi:uncharacterized protein LOC123546672 [Mercenaria mercenaria]|uniref:uncharacterized protein LOC123546672 n=1 Tax=Mercenaria mercenaria TaxID=6596 RepID=UPI00234F7D0B|nr:uncharacterized protein LOC123546672 [Mercenaria mercenaria]
MAATEISLSDIPDDFGISYLNKHVSLRRKQKAQAFVSGCYVERVKFYKISENIVQIGGEVYPSVKKNEQRHVVSLDVDVKEKVIVEGYCRCQQGDGGTCSHIIAILYLIEQWKIIGYKDVSALLSSTSLPQQWDRPRGGKIKSEPVSQMVIARPTNLTRKRKPVMTEFKDNRKIPVTNDCISALKQLNGSPISYLVEESSTSTKYTDTHIGPQVVGSGLSYHANLMECVHEPRKENGCGDITIPADVQLDGEAEKNISENASSWAHLRITSEDAQSIERKTRMQSGSKDWHEHRKNRITASVFGSIIKRKKEVNESFLKNTFCQKPFVSKPTSYGQVHEKTAKILYVKKTGNHLHDVGLVVNPTFPFLGATPDALVCAGGSTGLVEVKCPYSARNYSVLQAIQSNVKDFCLIQTGENIELNRNHAYYFQVQGQLLVTGMPFCEFIVYCNEDIFVQRIEPDRDIMLTILKKMTDFYIKNFKPYMESLK